MECRVRDIPAGTGKLLKKFYSVVIKNVNLIYEDSPLANNVQGIRGFLYSPLCTESVSIWTDCPNSGPSTHISPQDFPFLLHLVFFFNTLFSLHI